ncbi:UNVERIFIED_CONTAM: hypothetical protein RKD43_005984 [Streptomyces graminofaciens]
MCAEFLDVGGERRDEFLVAPGVARARSAGPYPGVRGGQFGAHRRGEAMRQDARFREVFRALGQRAVGGVVSAEDE